VQAAPTNPLPDPADQIELHSERLAAELLRRERLDVTQTLHQALTTLHEGGSYDRALFALADENRTFIADRLGAGDVGCLYFDSLTPISDPSPRLQNGLRRIRDLVVTALQRSRNADASGEPARIR
jgi:hypothetical protein